MARSVLLTFLALAFPGAAHAAWRMPIEGAEVAAPFHYDRHAPFAAGQRRGIDLRTRPGTPVLAVCSGSVRHAGALPSGGLGVSLVCGGLVATELGLQHVSVGAGREVPAGAVIGRAGATLRLGARHASSPFAYVDPLRLIDAPPAEIPVAPSGRVPRTTVPALTPRPAPAPVRAAPSRVPVPALIGATALLAALLIPARRRRPDSLSGQNGLLRHYADLLRQRRAAPGARLHDDRRRRAGTAPSSAWGGRLLPDRHR